jgi:7-cyano-7-deazaguanine synthase in queuosine biosynthesis
MKETKVQLFSGGFDSILQEWLIRPDILLYVDMKTSYSERELEALDRLPQRYRRRLIIKELPLGEYERENKYLPYRNLILGTIAMEYGQHVYFGFNRTDDAPDKDNVFLGRMTRLFDHLNVNCEGDMGWSTGNFSFSAPFKNLTKTQMLRMCLKSGMPVDLVRSIRSCYDGESQIGCGVCPVCMHKATALINNGISVEGIFDHPITVETFEKRLEYVSQIDCHPSIVTDTRKALEVLRKQQK